MTYPRLLPNSKIAKIFRENDDKLIKQTASLAKPFPKEKLPPLPSGGSLDWSPYVTFIRTQDGWGGCYNYAALHLLDILKEMEHPYTPDFSWRFTQYWHDYYWINNIGGGKADRILIDQGVCSEASVNTNYASCVDTTLPDQFDNNVEIWGGTDFGKVPRPDADSNAEAFMYRCQISDPITPDVDTLKGLLIQYGPIYSTWEVLFWDQTTGKLTDSAGHAMVFVGYDDTNRQFKFLNSWGDYSAINYISYADLLFDPQKTFAPWYVTSLAYFINVPSDRVNSRFAYTGRINVTSEQRNQLTVSVGVESQSADPRQLKGQSVIRVLGDDDLPGYIFWHHPDDNLKYLYDDCLDLYIDVPLPEYAAKYWPPSTSANKWAFWVKNTHTTKATVKEALLARLYYHPYCKSIGKFRTEVFEANQLPIDIPPNSTVCVTIASQTATAEPVYYDLTLVKSKSSMNFADLEATLLTQTFQVIGKKGTRGGIAKKPAVGKVLQIYEKVPNTCVNKPFDHVPILQKAVTDSNGKCLFHLYAPDNVQADTNRFYCAALADKKGDIIASSDYISIGW